MDRQGEPLNETQESKQAEREEVVATWIERPINRITMQRCLSGKNIIFEKFLELVEVYQDNGMFEKHDCSVRMAIHSYEEKGDFIKVLVLKIKSATYLYRYDWKRAKRLLVWVIKSDLPVEHLDVIKARASHEKKRKIQKVKNKPVVKTS